MKGAREATDTALAEVFREEAGRLTASLVRLLGDFDVAEELVQDAILIALQRWPVDGIPDRPGAWLLTAARRRAIDRLRRESVYREKLILLAGSAVPEAQGEDRLRLLFTCCHPALAPESQQALTLRAVLGLTTPEIARAFLVPESTIAQRIVRAKRKIVEARIPYRVPSDGEMVERLDGVLGVLYLLFNEGYLSTSGEAPARRDLAQDAEWLTSLLSRLLPAEPEILGLLALMRLHLARLESRFSAGGRLVLLEHQERSLWRRDEIAAAGELIASAAAEGRPGPYQLQAAIAAVHAEARTWESTDWMQILALYEMLTFHDSGPVVRLNRAVALRHVAGPAAALDAIEPLSASLQKYHLYHATRGELLRELGRTDDARVAWLAALELTSNPAERALLNERLT